jgi:hypothetical protein
MRSWEMLVLPWSEDPTLFQEIPSQNIINDEEPSAVLENK